MKIHRCMLLALTAGAFSIPATANTLYSFEDGLGGWASANTSAITLSTSTIGATHGTQSLAVTHVGNFAWFGTGVEAAIAALIAPQAKVYFDLTIVDMAGANWMNGKGAINTAGGWQETAQLDYPLTPGTHKVELDFTPVFPYDYTNWMQLNIGMNGPAGASRTYYIDNIRVVPEPGTIAALGLGAAALLRRRRK